MACYSTQQPFESGRNNSSCQAAPCGMCQHGRVCQLPQQEHGDDVALQEGGAVQVKAFIGADGAGETCPEGGHLPGRPSRPSRGSGERPSSMWAVGSAGKYKTRVLFL